MVEQGLSAKCFFVLNNKPPEVFGEESVEVIQNLHTISYHIISYHIISYHCVACLCMAVLGWPNKNRSQRVVLFIGWSLAPQAMSSFESFRWSMTRKNIYQRLSATGRPLETVAEEC